MSSTGNGNGQGRRLARGHRGLPALRELDELLAAADAEARVQRMPSVQLNALVNRLGLADAGPLLALASDEQARELVDLQVWQGDRVEIEELVDWLHELRSARETAPLLRALDVELLGFAIRRTTHIYLLEEDGAPEDPDGLVWATPDGWFALDIVGDTDHALRVRELLEALYGEDPNEARCLLQNLKWELPDELEEWALRWRNARLEDLGFADPIAALEVYAYLDPASVRPDEGTADRPLRSDPEPTGDASYALALFGDASSSLWSRAVALLHEEERQRLAPALLALANRSLAADRTPKGDLELGGESLAHLHWRLSLGLEHLADGDAERAAVALRNVALLRIARMGHSLVLDLRRRLVAEARRGSLGRRPGALDLLDLPLRDELAALLGQRPLLFDAATQQTRPFRDREDLRRASAWIDRALYAPRLVPPAARPAPLPAELTLGDLFRTDVINALLGRVGALGTADLGRFVEGFAREGRLTAAVPQRAQALAAERVGTPLDPPAAELAAAWIARLEDEVGALRAGDIDPRFVGGLWLET